MLTNHLYNLIEQLSTESQSTWRMKKYMEDAINCPECLAFWEHLTLDKEKHIADLTERIQKHMSAQIAA